MDLEPIKEIPFSLISPISLIGAAIFSSVFPAIPEEVFLISFGYLANTQPLIFPFFKIIIYLIIGFLIIDTVAYYLAKRGNKIIYFIVDKILGINIKEKEEFLKLHINKIVFVSRFLVQFRIIGPVSAAITNLPIKKFLMIDFLALIIYVPTVMGIGYYFTDRVESVLSGSHVIRNIMLSLVILVLFVTIIIRLKKILLKEIKG